MELKKDYNVLSQSLMGYSIYGYHFNSTYQKIKFTKLLLNYYPHLKIKFEYALSYGLMLYLLKFQKMLNQKKQINENFSKLSTAIHDNRIKLELHLSIYIQQYKLNILNYIYMKKFKFILLYNIYIQKIILCYYSLINLFSKY